MKFMTCALLIVTAYSLALSTRAQADDIDVCKQACATGNGNGCFQFGYIATQFTEPIRALYVASTGRDGKFATYCGRIDKKYNGVITNRGKNCATELPVGNVANFEIMMSGPISANLSMTDDNRVKVLFDPAVGLSLYAYDPKGKVINGGNLLYISATENPSQKLDVIFWETSDGNCFSAFLKRTSQSEIQ